MLDVFEYQLTVSSQNIDMVGHVNNVVYLQWMQDAALAHSAALGWPAERYQEQGAGWVARLHQIEYLQPAYTGDQIVVQTWVADMKKVTSLRRYRMLKRASSPSNETNPGKDTLVAIAHTNWAFIDFVSRTPKRIPNEIASAYRVVPDSQLES